MTSPLIHFLGLAGPLPGDSGKWVALLGADAVKVTVVLVAGFLISVASKRASAASRHLVWILALCGALALPILSLVLPAWRTPSLSETSPFDAPAATRTLVLPAGRPRPSFESATSSSRRRPDSPEAIPQRWISLVLWIWATGSLIIFGRLIIGVLQVMTVVHRAKRIQDADCGGVLEGLAERLQVTCPVTLFESDRTTMPIAWGVFRSVIILPRGAGGWPSGRLRNVLSHELAHVSRRDCLTQVLAQIACCFYWFHPLIWLAAGQLRKERERACDDRVLGIGANAYEYAGHLLELARSLRLPEESWSVAVAMAQPSLLESRIAAMLDPKCNHRAVSQRSAALTTLAVLALVLPMAALQGRAERETGRIWGTVYDPSGAVVPGAEVTASNLDIKMISPSVKTDDAGTFEFKAIPAGHYLVEVSRPGFRPLQRKDVVLSSNGQARLDLTLEVGTVAWSVTVTGKSRRTGAAVPRPAPHRIRVGGDIQAAKLIRQAKPEYSEDNQAKGIEGTVYLSAVISKEGDVLSATVLNKPDPELAKAALDAVK